jgi:class III poly(R)-hydroxyalkanoic acid synthase PhaE subunit
MGFEQLAAQVHGAAGPIRQEVGALLSLPTFGYAREHQERAKLLASAMVEYEEQLAHYNAQMMKASQKGLEKLEDKLAERSEPGRELGSLRAVYDLWIDAAEEGYSEVVLADDFRKVYGDLVNSQMRVRKLIQDEIERMAISVGMPSRTELNAVHRRLAEMRRRLAALEEVHGSASGAAKPAARAAASAATKRPDSKAAKKRAVKPPRRAPARPARAAVGKQPAKVATFAAKLAKTRGKAGKSVARKGGK